jgi:hypothetical protein
MGAPASDVALGSRECVTSSRRQAGARATSAVAATSSRTLPFHVPMGMTYLCMRGALDALHAPLGRVRPGDPAG